MLSNAILCVIVLVCGVLCLVVWFWCFLVFFEVVVCVCLCSLFFVFAPSCVFLCFLLSTFVSCVFLCFLVFARGFVCLLGFACVFLCYCLCFRMFPCLFVCSCMRFHARSFVFLRVLAFSCVFVVIFGGV